MTRLQINLIARYNLKKIDKANGVQQFILIALLNYSIWFTRRGSVYRTLLATTQQVQLCLIGHWLVLKSCFFFGD
jgi:hypothetical protein